MVLKDWRLRMDDTAVVIGISRERISYFNSRVSMKTFFVEWVPHFKLLHISNNPRN